jgi:glutamine amidotransferase
LRAKVVRFRFEGESLRVPHVGFNTFEPTPHATEEPLFRHLPAGARFYFTHSYHMVCDAPEEILGVTTYGHRFPSVVRRGSVMGTQFHPEKSHHFGLAILRGFLEV